MRLMVFKVLMVLIRPSIEAYSDGDLIGMGYFKKKHGSAYCNGQKAFNVPVPICKELVDLYNKRWGKDSSFKIFI